MRAPIFTNYSSRFIIPHHLIIRISLLLLTLGFFGGVWGQLFNQDFSSSTTLSSFINSTNPSNGQFNSISTSGLGCVLSINNGKLRFVRTGNAGSYSRTTNLSSTSPTSLIYKFDLTVSGNSTAMSSAAMFQIGSAFGTTNNTETNTAVHSRLGVNFTSTSGIFAMRDVASGVNSSNLSGTQSMIWVVNNSGGPLTYKAPDGTFETIANDKWDLWAGTMLLFNDSPSTTSTQTLDDLKFVYNSGTATIDLDNIIIDPIPTVPDLPILSGFTSTAINVDWNPVTGATGYRIDVDNDNDFSSPLLNYNNLLLSGTSQVVSGLSSNTTYYVRVRTENFAGTSNHSQTASGATTCTTGTYTGANGNWSTNSNWCGGNAPTNTTDVVIPSGVTVTLDASTTTVANLTVSGTLILPTNNQLTLTGALTNNGTLTLENGATFKQGASVSGGGTYNIQQNLDNCTNDGTNPTGRFWYLGSPVTSLRENSFGNAGNLNKVWSFTNGAYTAIADGATLSPTTGYVHRRGSNALPLTFTGINLYAEDVTLSLSNNAGTYGGWHLIANPYTAYLDWHQVYNASNALSSAISPSYYIRSFNSTGNDVNALITYNSSTGLESNTSSLSLTSAQAQYIAPMQAIWVKINPTTPLSATAGQLRLERAFTSHQTGNVGLKSSTIFPALARVNLVDGARFDQLLVYMNQDMTNAVDQYDSEKMFVTGAPQLYTMAAGKKLVMNGLKNNKSKISVPLYLELPESKVYQLSLAEYILEDGIILLEDKQEGTIQDFTIHDVYAFYATGGVLQNRFVLHFFKSDNGITAQGPSNTWVEEEAAINEGGNILVNSNGRGKVTIQQDIDQSPTAKGSVVVRDAAGREVWKGQLSGSATTLELDTPSGIYFVEVELNGQLEMKKIFVQQ